MHLYLSHAATVVCLSSAHSYKQMRQEEEEKERQGGRERDDREKEIIQKQVSKQKQKGAKSIRERLQDGKIYPKTWKKCKQFFLLWAQTNFNDHIYWFYLSHGVYKSFQSKLMCRTSATTSVAGWFAPLPLHCWMWWVGMLLLGCVCWVILVVTAEAWGSWFKSRDTPVLKGSGTVPCGRGGVVSWAAGTVCAWWSGVAVACGASVTAVCEEWTGTAMLMEVWTGTEIWHELTRAGSTIWDWFLLLGAT